MNVYLAKKIASCYLENAKAIVLVINIKITLILNVIIALETA